MRSGLLCCAAVFAFASVAPAEPRIDNVLERMVPPGSTSLIGAHMDQVKQTEIYKKMVATQSLVQVDQFAKETGFDPRRDVRELLFASSPRGQRHARARHISSQLRHIEECETDAARAIRHLGTGGSGFCILDSTLAAAGELPVLEAALDEWKSGTHTAAQSLLAHAGGVNPQSSALGSFNGAASFLADHPPGVNSGIDFAKIFRSLQDTWFQADLSAGVRSEVHGTTATEKDAINLRDAVRGMVGLGRLNVPENQSDLLKVWDGITVDQQGRSISIHADIAQNLIDKMVEMMNAPPAARRIL